MLVAIMVLNSDQAQIWSRDCFMSNLGIAFNNAKSSAGIYLWLCQTMDTVHPTRQVTFIFNVYYIWVFIYLYIYNWQLYNMALKIVYPVSNIPCLPWYTMVDVNSLAITVFNFHTILVTAIDTCLLSLPLNQLSLCYRHQFTVITTQPAVTLLSTPVYCHNHSTLFTVTATNTAVTQLSPSAYCQCHSWS